MANDKAELVKKQAWEHEKYGAEPEKKQGAVSWTYSFGVQPTMAFKRVLNQ